MLEMREGAYVTPKDGSLAIQNCGFIPREGTAFITKMDPLTVSLIYYPSFHNETEGKEMVMTIHIFRANFEVAQGEGRLWLVQTKHYTQVFPDDFLPWGKGNGGITPRR